jgi:hypothetical protein
MDRYATLHFLKLTVFRFSGGESGDQTFVIVCSDFNKAASIHITAA